MKKAQTKPNREQKNTFECAHEHTLTHVCYSLCVCFGVWQYRSVCQNRKSAIQIPCGSRSSRSTAITIKMTTATKKNPIIITTIAVTATHIIYNFLSFYFISFYILSCCVHLSRAWSMSFGCRRCRCRHICISFFFSSRRKHFQRFDYVLDWCRSFILVHVFNALSTFVPLSYIYAVCVRFILITVCLHRLLEKRRRNEKNK